MNRILLAGLVALTMMAAACSRAPGAGEPEPRDYLGADEPLVLPDSISEVEIRAFLAAEVEERLADEQADSAVAGGEHDKEAAPSAIDQADFDLPVTINERVEFWMDYFQNRGRERFATYLSRMGRYEELIRSELRAREMPEDLIYLALIESGFSPSATSSAAAVGIWQFIAPTARHYKLEVSRYVDERRDPVRSTEAALTYLQALYNQFGSWYLAAAGYNSGENRVERILRERVDGVRGEEDLFWKISDHLPSETRNYVPKLIAAAILGKYRDRYGFGDVVPQDAPPYEIVTIPDATELGVIARAAGVKQNEIEALNPHFLRGITPPRQKVEVRVPAGRAEDFRVAYAKIPPSRRVTKVEHIVRKGETLSGIAKKYGTTVAAIQETNRIKNAHTIGVGRTLVISYGGAGVASTSSSAAAAVEGRAAEAAPVQKNTSGASAPSTASKGSDTVYLVRSGDSLWSIAQRHGVSIEELRSWNKLKSNKIVPGQKLRIRIGEQVVVYRIQPGDTVWGIAQRHGISADRLMQWNKMDKSAVIRPGEELEVPVTQ